jgi:hypothetical protein
MPTAIPFTALGRGNGFSFCPTRKTSSTNFTGSSMTFSLEKVMEVYWKYSNPTGTDTSVVATPPNVDGALPQVNISSDASQSFFAASRNSASSQFIEPLKRVCGDQSVGLGIVSASSGFYQYNGVPYPYDLSVSIGYESNITIIEDEDNLSSANRFGVDFGYDTGGFYRHFSNGATVQNDLNKRIATYNPGTGAAVDGVVTQDTFDGITVFKWKEISGYGSGYFSMSFNDVPEMTGVEKYTFTP